MRRVIVESPFAPQTPQERCDLRVGLKNVDKKCLKISLDVPPPLAQGTRHMIWDKR